MGRVTLERLADGTPVAVKRLRPALFEESSEQPQDLVVRFEREIRAMLLLSDYGHPNVVPILRYGADPLPWFAMPLAGQSLEMGLAEIHASLRSIIRTSLQVLAGIEAAHEHGIFHRDLKLSNVLLYPDHRGYSAKVADFGLCRITSAGRLTATGSAGNGSALYSAPELLKDLKNADYRADIFSFGVVLFNLLTGRMAEISVRDYLDNGRSQPETANLTDSGREIIRACVDPDRSKRPGSIAELREWLWNAATELCNTPNDLDQEQRLELALEFRLPFVREDTDSSSGQLASDRNALFEELERLDSSSAWYVREFPSLQWNDLSHLIQHDPVRFSKRIARFGRAVGEDWLTFRHVDRLGAFLKGLMQADQSGAVLREGLGPMLNLALRHERYEVADQVHDLLGGIKERDKQKLDSCKSCFAQHPAATKWFLGGKRNRRDELTRFPIGAALPPA